MIKPFVPEKIEKKKLDYEYLKEYFGYEINYASKGRYALLDIVKYLSKKDPFKKKILVPLYFCGSIKEVLFGKYFIPEYYDIDLYDLNPSSTSIEEKLEKKANEILAVIVPSFYGNPADLENIEAICKQYNVNMIDDAAQCFGGMLNDRNVGSFGDFGLMAFSPGKPTACHMGSFYCKKGVEKQYTKHNLSHYIIYKDFQYNRQFAYNVGMNFRRKLFKNLCRLINRFVDISNDSMAPFESELLGGCIANSLAMIKKRQYWRNEFVRLFSNTNKFRIIKNVRGTANPCKIVFCFNDKSDCDIFKNYLENAEISYFPGYEPLDFSIKDLINTNKIIGNIVELPIELNQTHMKYMIKIINDYLEKLK